MQPPPPRGAEVLEAPKAARKMLVLNKLSPKASEKICDWPRARRKNWAPSFEGGGGQREWVGGAGPPRPSGAEFLKGGPGWDT